MKTPTKKIRQRGVDGVGGEGRKGEERRKEEEKGELKNQDKFQR